MKYVLPFCIVAVLTSCKTALSPAQEAKAAQVEQWVDNQNFKMDMQTAFPNFSSELNLLSYGVFFPPGNTSNTIDLMGRGDYITVKGDSIYAELSYYGTRQNSLMKPNGEIGIDLHTEIDHYKIEKQPNKNRTLVWLEASNDSEQFNFFMTIFASGRFSVKLNSSERNPIRYDGVLVTPENDTL